MNARRLKLLTRELIEACGGLTEATAACRYAAPQLSRCQTVDTPDFLALDVVAALEAYCGQPIVSRALFEEQPAQASPANLIDEASEVTETAAALQGQIRLAAKDGVITPRERQQLRAGLHALKGEIRDVEASLDAEDVA